MGAVVAKKVANAVLFEGGAIKLENVRLSYPHLDKPYAGEEGSEPKFSVTLLMDKKTHKEAQALVIAEINRLCAEKKWLKDGKRTIPADKLFIKNGDDSGKDEYQGMWAVSAREKNAPILRDRTGKKNVERDEAARVFYPGCYATVVIRPWVQDNKYGKRINANLNIVQFVKDGESFAEGRIGENDADDMLDAAEEDGIGADDEGDDL